MEKFCPTFQSLARLARLVLPGVFAVAALIGGATGCGDDTSSDPRQQRPEGRFALTNHENWSAASSDDDPFVDRPIQVNCPASSFGPEELNGEDSFAVLTDFCDYLTARQATTQDVLAGDMLHYRIFHFGLEAEQPSQAHVALRIGTQTLADTTISIPSDSGLLAGDFPAEVDMPAGTLVYFHVHNHGANEYSLVELTAEAP